MATRIFGIDASMTSTAICVLDEDYHLAECIVKTSSTTPDLLSRFDRYNKGVKKIVDFVSNNLLENNYVFLEGYSFGSKNGKAVSLAEYGTILRLELLKLNVILLEVPPTVNKKFAAGKGNANNVLVATSLTKQYGKFFENDDAADAFSLAHLGKCVLQLEKVKTAKQQAAVDVIIANLQEQKQHEFPKRATRNRRSKGSRGL
jgi:Holliday junction resolvasome RuvABC endonuclease subunit